MKRYCYKYNGNTLVGIQEHRMGTLVKHRDVEARISELEAESKKWLRIAQEFECENENLREAAQDYIEGGHFLDCKALRVTLKNPRCTCGHDALTAALEAKDG